MDTLAQLAPVGPHGLLVCMCAWYAVFRLGKWASATVWPTVYSALNEKQQKEWDNYVFAWTHAVVGSVVRNA